LALKGVVIVDQEVDGLGEAPWLAAIVDAGGEVVAHGSFPGDDGLADLQVVGDAAGAAERVGGDGEVAYLPGLL
jgi:hypothetical protein